MPQLQLGLVARAGGPGEQQPDTSPLARPLQVAGCLQGLARSTLASEQLQEAACWQACRTLHACHLAWETKVGIFCFSKALCRSYFCSSSLPWPLNALPRVGCRQAAHTPPFLIPHR